MMEGRIAGFEVVRTGRAAGPQSEGYTWRDSMAKKSGKEHPRVFISYSHDSEEHADKVLAFASKLRAEGIDAVLDQYEESPPEGWPMWMDREIRKADFVLMICTETYFKRVMGEEEPGRGLGVKWEGKLIYQHIYQGDAENSRFVPVLFEEGEVGNIPTPLQDATRYYVDTKPGYEKLYRRLTNQRLVKKAEMGEIKILPSLPERERRGDYLEASIWFSDQWPETDPNVFGRGERLELLDKAWGEKKLRIVSFVAAGGVGKTALVNRWKNFHMVPDKWRGTDCVFGWSFYSQGSDIGRQVSADAFIKKALEWFGDKEMAESTRSPAEKGQRLAELVKRRRTLLLLDGLEPLQEPPGSRTGQEGQLRDRAVAALVRGLATGGEGLCVISTRVSIDDLRSYEGGTAEQVDLDNLTPEEGAAYLGSLGVHGREDELVDASKEYGNHALALTLLGHFLKVHHGGNIRLRGEISNVMGTRRHRRHAEHIMAFYEKWFEGQAELELLYVLGLFDRPVERAAIDSVCGSKVIEGLTDKLNGLTDGEWDEVLYALREARLISRDASREKLDCHPLVREHFGEKLRRRNGFSWRAPHRRLWEALRLLLGRSSQAWREAHGRLYKYYKGVPGKDLPDTLEEMEPLFRAVYHGCAAGRGQETFVEVYWERINRGNEYFVMRQLGAFGSWLGAVACFFEEVWDTPEDGLSETDKVIVLNHAGLALRAVGRVREATEPMKAALSDAARLEWWEEGARDANNLSELYLTLGDVGKAVEYGRRCVEYAEKSGDKKEYLEDLATLADALHQAGEVAEAKRLFEEAEGMQQERQAGYRYLYSVWGYRYCELLLAQGKAEEVKERARQTLEWGKKGGYSLLSLALDKLSIGKALLAEAASKVKSQKSKVKSEEKNLNEAKRCLDEAVDGLRKAGTQHHIPRGLLARAGYYRIVGNYEKALGDLEEVREIAERGGMGLWLADYHLESARVASAERGAGSVERGKRHYEEAKRLVKECGYHRRDGEISELED